MNAQTNTQSAMVDAGLKRIRRLSVLLGWCSMGMALALPLGIVAGWLLAGPDMLVSRAGLSSSPVYGMSLLQIWQRVAGIGLTMVPAGFMVCALLHVRRCFVLFADGRFFEAVTVKALGKFAAGFFGATISGLLISPLISVLLTAGNPPGYRHLEVAIGSGQLFALLLSGLVWLIASVMARAVVLAEENAQFV